MVPIRKGDGTGLAAKGYSQVRKGDGTVLWNAIPDRGMAYYDVTEETPEEDEVTIWQDQIGERDLEGPTGSFDPDAINGNGGIPITSASHELVNTAFDESQPLTIYFVIDINDNDERQAIFGTNAADLGGEIALEARFSDNEYLLFGGDPVSGGTPVAGPQIGVAQYDGADSLLRINGDTILDDTDGDVGSLSLDGFVLGNRGNTDRPMGGDYGLFHPVNEKDSLETIQDTEQEYADIFDISLS